MTLQLLVAAFALLMLLRHGRRALPLVARGASAEQRWQALPSFLTVSVALLLLARTLQLLVRPRP